MKGIFYHGYSYESSLKMKLLQNIWDFNHWARAPEKLPENSQTMEINLH